jgi:hypothetical protein
VKRVKDGWVVHVTERGEIVHAILNLSLCVCVWSVWNVRNVCVATMAQASCSEPWDS